jgi:hypothetical protein
VEDILNALPAVAHKWRLIVTELIAVVFASQEPSQPRLAEPQVSFHRGNC